MSYTAHSTEEDKVEHFDSEEVLQQKVALLASLIASYKHFIAFTGAGISTACGIPDFRSGVGTVLKTGPGAWQKKAMGIKDDPNNRVVQMAKAVPSFTHMTLVALQEAGLLKFLVSQNTDGLHMRSGFNVKKLAELHGNRCLQKCPKCYQQFLRDFRTRQAQKVHDHDTSRKCPRCNVFLKDSIINFGENLPAYEINTAFQQAEKADICLAMGSSLTVTPAADVPKTVGKKQKLVIINLQATPLDKYAYLRINGLCEDVMKRLANKLNLVVRNWTLKRLIEIKDGKGGEIVLRGVDKRGIHFSCFKQVSILIGGAKKPIKGEPYLIEKKGQENLTINLEFYRYYKQPDYKLVIPEGKKGVLEIEFSPIVGEWTKGNWIEE